MIITEDPLLVCEQFAMQKLCFSITTLTPDRFGEGASRSEAHSVIITK